MTTDIKAKLKEIEDLIFQQFLEIKTAQLLVEKGTAKSLSEIVDHLNEVQALANTQSTKRSVVIGSLELQINKKEKKGMLLQSEVTTKEL